MKVDILKPEVNNKVDVKYDTFEMLKLYKQYGLKRIMIVDDEEFCQATMKALLGT